MINNAYRYVKNVINIDKFLEDTANKYRLVSQKLYKGNPEKDLPKGVTVTLQIVEDNSEPIIDKETGLEKDNNVFETFDVTILDKEYPLDIKKGDYVRLSGFREDCSYYINFNFILRFDEIEKMEVKDYE